MDTPERYVFKLKYDYGLLWMPMEYPKTKEVDMLVHVNITIPLLWEPDGENEEGLPW